MTIPTCSVCGGIAGHSAEACLETVARQRNAAIRERVLARWRLLFAENDVGRGRRVACYFWRKRDKNGE